MAIVWTIIKHHVRKRDLYHSDTLGLDSNSDGSDQAGCDTRAEEELLNLEEAIFEADEKKFQAQFEAEEKKADNRMEIADESRRGSVKHSDLAAQKVMYVDPQGRKMTEADLVQNIINININICRFILFLFLKS